MSAAIFPVLAVLEGLGARVCGLTKGKLDDVAFVCVQHLLETTGSLFECLIRLGALPENIFVLGKCYSTNADVLRRLRLLGVDAQGGTTPDKWGCFTDAITRDVAELWKRASQHCTRRGIRSIIVLDDGGHCLVGIPKSERWRVVAGVEQTTRGLRLGPSIKKGFPIIQVARSAAKQYIEPPMISHAVVTKLDAAFSVVPSEVAFGVIGLGRIGQAVANHLMGLGRTVFACDYAPTLVDSFPGGCDSAEELLSKANFVFGCTGHNVLDKADWLGEVRGTKTFASCSTGDVEFRALLKFATRQAREQDHDPFGSASGDLRGGSLTVLRGGFPINFDGSPESVPATDIQMTRGLLLGGIIQALLARDQRGHREEGWEKLDPAIQRFVVGTWLESQRSRTRWFPESTLSGFTELIWIQEHSRGYDASYPALAERIAG